MIKSYLKSAWRNLIRSKAYSTINIIGLAAGAAIALLIGLWVWDELSFDQYYDNFGRLAQVMDVRTINGETNTNNTVAIPLADELRSNHGDDFKHVAVVFPNFNHTVAVGDKRISASGIWAQPDLPEMLTLKMVSGERDVLKDPSSVLITQSLARALFGDSDPFNKVIRLDNATEVKVAGVYEDFPQNTTFYGTKLILSWNKALSILPWLKEYQTKWDSRFCWLFVEMNENVDIAKANIKIHDMVRHQVKLNDEEIWLHPMSKWHLYNEFKNGKAVGGRIRLVWLFGFIGGFVLLLACINFMNLSTARSAKRAKEVGIRKAIGCRRGQLIGQFLIESLLVASLAFILAIGMVMIFLPVFNGIVGKQIHIPFRQPVFWIFIVILAAFTGIISGSYPAFYLSAFLPVKVLKGTFKSGRLASLPRKILIVFQFTVSIILIMGTIIVYRQLQYAKNRPVGYTRKGLLSIDINTMDLINAPYNSLRDELLLTGCVKDMSKSSNHATELPGNSTDFNWAGKDPHTAPTIAIVNVTHDFGNTMNWHIKEGRDFSRNFTTDTGAFIMNEAAVKLTGLKNPVGEIIRLGDEKHKVVGVVKDMVMESPYISALPTIFILDYKSVTNDLTVRIKPGIPMREALSRIASVFGKYNPGGAFTYQFTDMEYAKKFANEERIENLSLVFALFAILISCLGLSGLASFIAEQRTKEMGIRKVLGASVLNLWELLSKDFMILVIISLLIASPLIYYFMYNWLLNYEYRTKIPWWVFAAVGAGTLIITMLSVSFQSIKAALMNPTKSLRSE